MADLAREYLQVRVLKTLEPLSSLAGDKLEELANKSTVEELPPGRVVFRQGEKDKRCVYLLAGTIELAITGNPNTELIKAKTLEAKYPLAQEIPRPSTCRTKTNCVLLSVDADLLEFLMDDSPSGMSGMYEVTEISVDEDPESDWMLRFLQSPAFLNLPTDKIQNLLARFEEYPAKKGQAIIKQGGDDQYYYIVKTGQCIVSRKPAPAAEEIRLAILGPGDGFGEEALITQGKRNATITMKDDGVLMRLKKQDFQNLLVKPLLKNVEHHQMMDKVKSGAVLIDVRTNKEFTENGIKGAQNIPLSMLRVKIKSLNPTREHILYCNDSNQSSAAAFLLAQQGITCFVLSNGLNAQQKAFATSASEPHSSTPLIPSSRNPIITDENPLTATGEFTQHRREVQAKSERADAADKFHKKLESRSQQLRSEADALRSQAAKLTAKTAAAETERRKAEAEIQRLQEDAARQREEMLNTAKLAIAKEKEKAQQEALRLKQEAEQARKHAEEELKRIQRESSNIDERQSQLESEFKQAELEKLKAAKAAEEARRIAKLEAERVKQEADAIRQRALDEAKALRESIEAQRAKVKAEEQANRTKALEDARRRAETAITQAAQAAEEARKQAQLEAEAIRRAALEEAQRLRADAEKERKQLQRKHAEDKLRHEQLLENVRQQALEDAQRKAEREAEAIRNQALMDAQQLRSELEAARVLIEEENRRTQDRQIEEEAARLAEEEALALAAAEEAEQVALEAARRVQEEIARRRDEEYRVLEVARRRREEEQRALEDSRRREEEYRAQAERRRREEEQRALEETRRREEERKVQAEAKRRAELSRLAALEEQARLEREEAEQQRAMEEARLSRQKSQVSDAVRQRAENLKDRLSSQDFANQHPDEFLMETGQGVKLASAKLHIVKDKTVLEGEQDIFIFKAPSQRPPSREEAEALIKKAEQQMRETARKELPSFDIEYADKKEKPAPATAIHDKSGFSDSVLSDLDQLAAYSKPRTKNASDEFEFALPEPDINESRKSTAKGRRHLYTLAASIVVMVIVSVVAINRPTYVDVNMVNNAPEQTPSDQRGLASMRSAPSALNEQQNDAAQKADAESRVRNEAEQEFQRMLNQWRSEQTAKQ